MARRITIIFSIWMLVSFTTSAEEELATIEINEKTDKVVDLIEKENFLKDAPMQKQVTSEEAIHIAGSNGDPLRVISTLAGVVTPNPSNGNEIYIHGSKPRETIFSINQLPLGYLYHLGGLHSVIAPESIAQIDAYLGGFDATYGAMGAVVDITPNYPSIAKKSARAHIGLYDADFAYSSPVDDSTAFFISARRSYIDFFLDNFTVTDDNDSNKKTTFTLFPQYYDANFILIHIADENVFSIEAITSKDALKLKTNVNEDIDPTANGKVNVQQGFTTTGLRWRRYGNQFTSHTLLSWMTTNANIELFNVNYFVKQSAKLLTLFNENTTVFGNHKSTIGGQLRQSATPVDVYAPERPNEDKKSSITSATPLRLKKTFKAESATVFAQDIYSLNSGDKFRYGLRHTKVNFQKFSTFTDPRIAYIHKLNDTSSLSFALGQYSQFPDTITVSDEFGNPYINTFEYANHAIIGWKKTMKNDAQIEIEPFYKTFKNLVIAYDDDSNSLQYDNGGTGRAYGLDITYRKKIGDVKAIIAYTYTNAKRQLFVEDNLQRSFVGDIPHTLQISADLPFVGTWRISTSFKYSTGKPYTPVVGATPAIDSITGNNYYVPINGEPYSKRLPDTYDWDIQFSKKKNYKDGSSLEYQIDLMNLSSLFVKNIESVRYNQKYQENGYYMSLGFLPAFHMIYRF